MSVYSEITQKIVTAIESGVDGSGFKMPWHRAGGGRPINASTRAAYRGMNTLNLWLEGQRFDSDEWATFNQWKALGAQVKKGSKSSLIVFWKPLPADDEDDKRFVLKTSRVFNAEQVEGYETARAPTQDIERLEIAERFISAVPIDLRFGGGRAYYNRMTDHVQMPPADKFFTAHGYYSTLLHECAHWTGNEKRLDRKFGKRFGDEAYAFEELVAELSAAFLCADLGVSNEPREDHAEYVAGWLKALEGDVKAIFTAATAAQKAVDFLTEFSEPKKKEKAA